MDDGTLNQAFYTSQDSPLSSEKLSPDKPEAKVTKNVTNSESLLPPKLSVSGSADQSEEDIAVSFELDITRVCVRNGAVRLPYSAKNLFEQKTDLVVRAAESRSEYVLSFIPPRILDNLEAFFADSNAKANDKLILNLHGNRGEIKLEKRQTTRRGRRDKVESKPTKHELLTAAAKAQEPAAPTAENVEVASEPIPEMPSVAVGGDFHPRANVGAGAFNKLKTVVMRPKQPDQTASAHVHTVQDEPVPVLHSPARHMPKQVETPKPNPVLRDTAPARYRVEPDSSSEAAPKPDTDVKRFKAPASTKDAVNPLANNAYVAPERYDISDEEVGKTFRRTVPSGFAPVGDDDIPPMPTDLELEAEPPHISPPSDILIQELQSHMSRPSTPAILRVDDVADVLGLKADRVQQALQALSEEEDPSIRAIREGVFQILRRDMSSL